MNSETLNIKFIENHFRFLKNLDTDTKKRLIIRLTESIETSEKPDKLERLFGAWKDSRGVEEIVDDLNNSKINSREVENLK